MRTQSTPSTQTLRPGFDTSNLVTIPGAANYGPPLILAAALPEQVMIVHPAIAVADMLASHYTHLIQSQQPAATLDPELEKETS